MTRVVTDVNLSSGRIDYGDVSGGGSGVPSGGTTGQFLAKRSNTDGDVEWKDPSPRLGYDTVDGIKYISVIED